ncbi:type IV secretory system conjugative DNA transfer family protein [Myxococcus vastator]|uniref:type IV secretory system conjugative DNA transfer family protein n=1 Tax=Myxococcus vastator TaxID=2709664 RepID=UPI0013D5E4B4|nr:TraM recognition domain-containing protein [Myxococcus vastator]
MGNHATRQQEALDASAQSTSTGVLFLLVGGVVIFAYHLQRLPPGEAVAQLVEHSNWLGVAGLVLLAPLIGFGLFDYRSAERRTYVPPSLPTQVARAIAYGLGLLLAQLLLMAAWRPALVVMLSELEERAASLLLLVLPLAALAWALTMKRRTFIVPELPSYREVVEAQRETYDFVIGRTGTEWKTGEGDPSWCVIPRDAMFANIYCLGGIGSGKTSAVAKPLMDQAIFKFPNDPKQKVGGLILDAKGNNANYILMRAQQAGRGKDVVIIRPGGDWSFNPLGSGTPNALAAKLVAALEVMTEQESNSYYKKMQTEFATAAFQVLQDAMGVGKFSLMDLYRFTTNQQFQQQMLDAAKPKASLGYQWFIDQWSQEDPKEKMMLTKGFRADLMKFVQDDMASTFCKTDANFPGWKAVLEEGKIVVFSMSLDQYGALARAMGIFVLIDFQAQMLARTTPDFRKSGGNTERLVMCFLDEVWAYMNPGIAEFTSVSRESRCCTVALHQGLDQIPLKYRGTITGNFRTSVILAVNDLLSMETFAKLFGSHKETRASRSESTGYSGVEKDLLTDHLTAKAGGESRSVSVSLTEVDAPRFSSDDILRLPERTAVLQMFDGLRTSHPRLVKLLPNYLEENRILPGEDPKV